MKLGAKWAEQVQLKKNFVPQVVSEFFRTNTPDSPLWTLNSYFGAFRSVWVHFGLFRYCAKLDAKSADMVELMHKFVA